MADLFSAAHTTIAGIARAGDASISFTQGETEYTLAAMNVQVTYSEKISPIVLPGGKVLIFSQIALGQIQIGALLGNGIDDFLAYFGDLCNIAKAENSLIIVMQSGITCSPALEALDVAEKATFTCVNCKITDFGVSNQIQGIVVSTNMSVFALNVDLTISDLA